MFILLTEPVLVQACIFFQQLILGSGTSPHAFFFLSLFANAGAPLISLHEPCLRGSSQYMSCPLLSDFCTRRTSLFSFFFLSSYAFSQTWYTTCYKLFIQVILSVRDARLERSYFETQVKLLLQILMIPHSNNHIRECLMLLNRFHLTSLIIIGAQGRSQPSWSLGSSSQESWGPQTR